MTIEIADRLIKLRKKNNLSQEELADKLGISRQAVSKWERAEASPDTDNLICLAKLYNISLDELLNTDLDAETIVKEQVKEEKEEEKENKTAAEEEKKNEGMHIKDDEGNEIHISPGHIKIESDDGDNVDIDGLNIKISDADGCVVEKARHKDRFTLTLEIIESALFVLMIILYILLGVFLDMWVNGWVFIFVPEIICSIPRAIKKRNANKFNMTFLSCFAFFFVCMIYPGMEAALWHPMWVVFLAIPAYHAIIGAINKSLGKKDD